MKRFKSIHLPRQNPPVLALAAYLAELGYAIEFPEQPRAARGWRDYISSIPTDTLVFAWTGPLRKATDDKWKPCPNLAYMEHGYLPHYETITIDPCGTGKHSSLIDYKLPLLPLPRREQPGKLWLYAAQLESDSVIRFDCAPEYRSIVGNVRRLLAGLPAGVKLLVKLHPRQPDPVKMPDDPRLHVIEGETSPEETAYLLASCSHFFTVNSSMIYEALTLGNAPITAWGECVYAAHDDNPTALLHELQCFRQIENILDCPYVWQRFITEWERTWE